MIPGTERTKFEKRFWNSSRRGSSNQNRPNNNSSSPPSPLPPTQRSTKFVRQGKMQKIALMPSMLRSWGRNWVGGREGRWDGCLASMCQRCLWRKLWGRSNIGSPNWERWNWRMRMVKEMNCFRWKLRGSYENRQPSPPRRRRTPLKRCAGTLMKKQMRVKWTRTTWLMLLLKPSQGMEGFVQSQAESFWRANTTLQPCRRLLRRLNCRLQAHHLRRPQPRQAKRHLAWVDLGRLPRNQLKRKTPTSPRLAPGGPSPAPETSASPTAGASALVPASNQTKP
mmetsp:Transcript_52068/g.110656  ORF Transcript_52068/g.110656 Transcript_52068/m.110656 type:complete len:281 (+) Transcript_52068:249-1091(+)